MKELESTKLLRIYTKYVLKTDFGRLDKCSNSAYVVSGLLVLVEPQRLPIHANVQVYSTRLCVQ